MKLEQIKQELKRQKLFIYKNSNEYHLAKRTQDGFELITEEVTIQGFKDKYKVNPLRYLLMQVNNQLLDPTETITDLKQVLTVIDFKVFTDYDDREATIVRYKEILKQIQSSKAIFGKKKWRTVKITRHNHLLDKEGQTGYWIINQDKEVVPIAEELLDDAAKKEAVSITYIDELKKALRDDMKNEYSESYNREVSKWQGLI